MIVGFNINLLKQLLTYIYYLSLNKIIFAKIYFN